jgi:broad specificity phosphatase PhoE
VSVARNVVWLVRHGHDDRATGTLTEKGCRRVVGLAHLLRSRAPGRIRSSPVRRSVETAALLSRELRLGTETPEPTLDPASYGPAGWPWASQWLTKRGGQPLLVAGLGIAAILGRPLSPPERRLLTEIERWSYDHKYRQSILVTHGELIRAVVHLLSSRGLFAWVRRGPFLLEVPRAAAVELGPVDGGWGYRSLRRPRPNSTAIDR